MSQPNPKMILLVEDEPSVALMTRARLRALESLSLDVRLARTLEEALAMLEESRFDLILLDLALPDSTGIDTFYVIYAVAAHIPIIVITGDGDVNVAHQLIAGGAQDFLDKSSINREVFSRAIRYAIDRHKQNQRMQQQAGNLASYIERLQIAQRLQDVALQDLFAITTMTYALRQQSANQLGPEFDALVADVHNISQNLLTATQSLLNQLSRHSKTS
jgi:DNA-binding NtrC family response regulator